MDGETPTDQLVAAARSWAAHTQALPSLGSFGPVDASRRLLADWSSRQPDELRLTSARGAGAHPPQRPGPAIGPREPAVGAAAHQGIRVRSGNPE
jgi:hypothetical protein